MSNFTNNQKKVLILVIVIAVIFIGYYVYTKDNNYETLSQDEEILIKTDEEETNEDTDNEKIKVHIMGAVKNAGIIELNEGARVADAIEKAGGLTDDANMKKINLAYIVEDGMKINIPSVNDKEDDDEEYLTTKGGDIVESNDVNNSKSENIGNDKININIASQTELETLPGIGPSTALKIIDYRNENGKFLSVEDIKNVNGIGDSKYENIKDLICIK